MFSEYPQAFEINAKLSTWEFPGHMPVWYVSCIPYYSSHKAQVPPNASFPTLYSVSNAQPHPLTLTHCLPPSILPWSSTLAVNATIMACATLHSSCVFIFTLNCSYLMEESASNWCVPSGSLGHVLHKLACELEEVILCHIPIQVAYPFGK